MGGELVAQPVGRNVVGVGVPDQCKGLVGHGKARHTAEEFQRLHLGANLVSRGLPSGGTGVGVIGGTKGGHKDLGLGNLSRGGVNDWHCLLSVVGKQLLTGHIGLAYRALEPQGPLSR